LVRIAAVDIGTNTVRLLLAEVVGQPGHLRVTHADRFETITKLGEGLDASGRLGEEPMRRALDGLARYSELIADAGIEHTGGVATEATRSATNGDEFVALATEVLGFPPRVIDGIEEADLTFIGATKAAEPAASYCVIDVGGGSTEFVVGRSLPDYAMSIDIGSVRLTERILSMQLGSPAAMREYVDTLFAGVNPPYIPERVLGSGGTFVTIGAVARSFSVTGPAAGSDAQLSLVEIRETVDRLLAMSVPEIAQLAPVPAGRAEVLRAGALCAERAAAHIGVPEITVSISDILDGLALHVAEESRAAPQA
jgi:exopolyphosphatase/guanosine-5'-triphosphate,3'-diphosphate pyrophosphatase